VLFFQLADKERNVFGDRFWVEFTVSGEETKQKKEETKTKETKEKQDSTQTKQDKQDRTQTKQTSIPTQTNQTSIPIEVKEKSSTDSDLVLYAIQLRTLEQMGFSNPTLVLDLVKKHKGNVSDVIGELVGL